MTSILLGLTCLLIYNANLRSIPAGDTYVARYLPFSIWRNHSLVLDPVISTVAQGRRLPVLRGKGDAAFWVVRGPDDHFVSKYPIAVPVLLAPLYLPATRYLDANGWDPLLFDKIARIMEKLCASLLAAGSVALLYLLLRRRSAPRMAACLALAYAFGTSTWVIGSQALWMHGLAEFLITATMLLLTGPCTIWRAIVAGLLCGLIAANRPPDTVLAAGLALYGLWWAGRRIPWAAAAALLPPGATLAYNLWFVGNIAGAYAIDVRPENFSDSVTASVAGLLFSPTHGLFVFSSFLLFVPLFLHRVLREPRLRGFTIAIGCAMLVQLVGYGFVNWRQGISFGPRWLTDMLPMFIWMLPPVLAGLSFMGRAIFALACGLSIAIEVIGAFWYTGVADAAVAAARGPDRMRAAWEIRNAPFIAELQHLPVSGDLLMDLRGNVDAVNVAAVGSAEARREVEILGWALADHGTPAGVVAMLDGRQAAGTNVFFTRPDVVNTLGEASPAGWRIAFAPDRLTPGDHVVSVLVYLVKGGEPRLLRERRFTVVPGDEPLHSDGDLANAARRASQLLAGHQQGPGYWLTDYTHGTQFERPHEEMNTYLNALMLDVAAPVADMAGLGEMLGRTRSFLTSQIEAGGLVRYHGLPDAPNIGRLGCAITPDADDTALVWRIAPAEHRDRLTSALATLDRFRRPDGLYRTWLAPREQYECLDPGRDPNPADIGIQMHVYLLLARENPEAARALCEVLVRKTADDDIWVYYADAPLVLVLRSADLRMAGCPLELPAGRLKTTVAGQGVWMQLADRLLATEEDGGRDATSSQTREVLKKIAADDFALLNASPPLLYHNDLTASVRRFYWSKDLGYALWLRLYYEDEQVHSKLSCRSKDPQQKCGEK